MQLLQLRNRRLVLHEMIDRARLRDTDLLELEAAYPELLPVLQELQARRDDLLEEPCS